MPVNTKKFGVSKFSKPNDPGALSSYQLFDEKLTEKLQEKDLGVLLSTDFSYKEHIYTMVGKALRVYGWLVRTLVSRDRIIIIRLYKTLIRPILEYASTIWSPHRKKLIEKVEKVQRKVTKFAIHWSPLYSYENRLSTLQLPSLKWRRIFLDLLMVHRIMHGDEQLRLNIFLLHSEQSDLNLRRHRYTIYKRSFKSDMYKNHFANRVVDSWNALPVELLDVIDFKLFKKRLKVYLMTCLEPYK